ncbi:TOPRIM nucleotidyl transferase/hydrolase domain-containing protein [Kitasatospora sp. NPDC054939]
MADMNAFREAVGGWAAGGPGGDAAELAGLLGLHTAVLVEGPSDLAAVEALAERAGRDLAGAGVCVLSIGGAMNIGRWAGLLGPHGLGLRLIGLCDAGEQGYYDRGLARAGTPGDGLFVCSADLEEEFIRALGVARVVEIVRAEGDLPAWQIFGRQPAQQSRSAEQRLRRFLGTKKGRKIRYGRLLAEALETDRVPAPLKGLFAVL